MDYDELSKLPPYSLDHNEKSAIYSELLSDLTDKHRKAFAPYDKACSLLGDVPQSLRTEEDIPMVPVSLFKQEKILSIPEDKIFKTLSSSGTTGQQVSRIYLDKETSARQQLALSRIVSDFTGPERLPMLIIDSPNVLKDRNMFSARGAGILGFSMFAWKRQYALTETMEPDYEGIERFLEKTGGEPVLIFGFTYMIWQYFCQPLKKSGRHLPLKNAFLIHGGGWKKLQDEAVSSDEFKNTLAEVCGISPCNIRDYYGMAEQTGCIYMECECGHLHASIYSDVITRRMSDFSVCDVGEEGVIEVLSPMTSSYAGHSILTEDKGIILGEDDCLCGRKGKYFKITGRIPRAEVRGCSDTYAADTAAPSKSSTLRLFAGTLTPVSTPLPCFSAQVTDFLSALSESIRALPRGSASEELRSLGFWLRRTNLEGFAARYVGRCRMGLGLSFHITPSNVPLLFGYSMAISLLAGNSCQVRISGRLSGETELFCSLVEDLLNDERFDSMRERISLFTYDSADTSLTERFSLGCDARIIWGGDETVSRIRRIPLKAGAAELVFPDRNSIAVLDADAVLALSDEDLYALAGRFYNDTYGMDENACSCPGLIFWRETSGEAGKKAAERFWPALARRAETYPLSELMVSRKYTSLWEAAGFKDPGLCDLRHWGNLLYVAAAAAKPTPESAQDLHFGSFVEYHMKNHDDWAGAVSEKTQTLVTFGCDPKELSATVKSRRLKGVTRIVPVGQALIMDPEWDGKDMIFLLSRALP